jgi:uncharacterized membrane protein
MLSARHSLTQQNPTNVGETERILSAIGGGVLVYKGLTGGSLSNRLLAVAGGYLLYRGLSGHCMLYDRLAPPREEWAVSKDQGINVEKAVTINKPAAELYSFWRDFENLPRFMNHLESVTVQDTTHSHWVAKAPLGQTVEWDAEIVGEKENEVISWRSLAGADVPNAGSVRFRDSGRGTEVRVSLKYQPPAGALGAAVAKLFGEEPEVQITEDLGRFKQLMETGVTATTEGQPSGRGRD